MALKTGEHSTNSKQCIMHVYSKPMTVSMPTHDDTILFKPGSDLLSIPEHPSQRTYLSVARSSSSMDLYILQKVKCQYNIEKIFMIT